MEADSEETSDRANLLDLSDIQSPVLDLQLEDIDAPESIDEPSVYADIVDGDLSDNFWQGPYVQYLLILPYQRILNYKLY